MRAAGVLSWANRENYRLVKGINLHPQKKKKKIGSRMFRIMTLNGNQDNKEKMKPLAQEGI